MARTLAIAAGGGGDAITAAVLARALHFEPVVMTYSWDRLIVDPLPGPRIVAEFQGLRLLAPYVFEVLPESTLTAPGNSTLPRLAGELPARLLLLDPSEGAAGMTKQIRAAADHFNADELAVIDVGGDAVSEGTEDSLRSPIADFLALAAATSTGYPVRLLTTGIALDGELSIDEVTARLEMLDAEHITTLTATDFTDVRELFEWHPSEGNGLLAAAAMGARGMVETRDHGGGVELTDVSTRVYAVDGRRAVDASKAAQFIDTQSLDDVEAKTREFHGTSEIDYERDKAKRRDGQPAKHPTADNLAELDHYAADAASRGVDYLSVRRAAELLGATDPTSVEQLRVLLRRKRPASYWPPLYRCASQAHG